VNPLIDDRAEFLHFQPPPIPPPESGAGAGGWLERLRWLYGESQIGICFPRKKSAERFR